jgi:hypothetical protein
MIGAPFTKRGDLMVPSQARTTRVERDSARYEITYVVRTSFADPERRDTVGRLERQRMRRDTPAPNGTRMSWILTGDGAGMFPDGTIAIVRTRTYSVELIDRRGRRREVKLPHEWTVLTQTDKEAAMDSLRAAARTASIAIEQRSSSGELVARSPGGAATVTSRLSDIADTVPPIGTHYQIIGDADGHLWIQKIVVLTNPYRSVREIHYDVIDRKGRLVRRVVLPPGSYVRAFAPGRVYYTAEEGGRTRLVMARTK